MTDMRMAVFVEYFPPRMGSDRRIFELMRRLSQQHEIHFIIFPPIRMLINVAEKGITKQHISTKKRLTCKGIIGHYVRVPSFIASMWRLSIITAYLLTAPLLIIKSIKILAELKPDAIILNYPSPYTGLLGFIAGKLWRKPIIVDFNDLIAQYTINLLHLKKDRFKAKMLIQVQNYIIRKSEKIVAPTFFLKKYVVANGISEKNVSVIPNGVDTEVFDPQKCNSEIIKKKMGLSWKKACFYCGRLDSWAGIHIISKLCHAAYNKKLNIVFALVGSGEHKITLKENVISLGERPYEEIPYLLAAADVVLIPFPNNEVSHAASPLKLFEGMALGKLVIASRVKGIEEVISDGENGYLADPNNIDEWIKKLEDALQSEQEVRRIGRKARQTVEKQFNWSLLAKKFEGVLHIAVAEHSKPYWREKNAHRPSNPTFPSSNRRCRRTRL